jgi:hypothetical protein
LVRKSTRLVARCSSRGSGRSRRFTNDRLMTDIRHLRGQRKREHSR